MQMLRFKCCIECFRNINHEDIYAGQLWPQLCKWTCIRGGFVSFKVDHKLDYEFSILEGLGFIRTHETDKELLVSVEGHLVDAELMHTFCIDINKHGHEV